MRLLLFLNPPKEDFLARLREEHFAIEVLFFCESAFYQNPMNMQFFLDNWIQNKSQDRHHKLLLDQLESKSKNNLLSIVPNLLSNTCNREKKVAYSLQPQALRIISAVLSLYILLSESKYSEVYLIYDKWLRTITPLGFPLGVCIRKCISKLLIELDIKVKTLCLNQWHQSDELSCFLSESVADYNAKVPIYDIRLDCLSPINKSPSTLIDYTHVRLPENFLGASTLTNSVLLINSSTGIWSNNIPFHLFDGTYVYSYIESIDKFSFTEKPQGGNPLLLVVSSLLLDLNLPSLRGTIAVIQEVIDEFINAVILSIDHINSTLKKSKVINGTNSFTRAILGDDVHLLGLSLLYASTSNCSNNIILPHSFTTIANRSYDCSNFETIYSDFWPNFQENSDNAENLETNRQPMEYLRKVGKESSVSFIDTMPKHANIKVQPTRTKQLIKGSWEKSLLSVRPSGFIRLAVFLNTDIYEGTYNMSLKRLVKYIIELVYNIIQAEYCNKIKISIYCKTIFNEAEAVKSFINTCIHQYPSYTDSERLSINEMIDVVSSEISHSSVVRIARNSALIYIGPGSIYTEAALLGIPTLDFAFIPNCNISNGYNYTNNNIVATLCNTPFPELTYFGFCHLINEAALECFKKQFEQSPLAMKISQ